MSGDIQRASSKVVGEEAARVLTWPNEPLRKLKTKGRGDPEATVIPTEPDPSPEPMLTQEVAAAKAKVRRRKRGRSENILAGRMMRSRQILNTGKRELGA